ncbi:MAG: hypothetical protein ABIJ09_07035 [Pseudomonadota bacterium]
MRNLTCVLVLGLLAATPALAQEGSPSAGPRLRLFVGDYEAAAGAPLDAGTANEILAARMSRLGEVFSLVTKEEVRKVLDYEAVKQLIGTEDDAAGLVQLGETIRADRLLYGRIGKVGETYVATLTLLDLQSGVVEKRVAGTFKGAQDLAITRLNEHADQMLAYLVMSYAPDKVQKTRRVAVKLGTEPPVPEPGPDAGAMGWRTPTGAAFAGLGLGLAAGAGTVHALTYDQITPWVPVALYGAGGVLVVTGAALMLWPE